MNENKYTHTHIHRNDDSLHKHTTDIYTDTNSFVLLNYLFSLFLFKKTKDIKIVFQSSLKQSILCLNQIVLIP